MAVNNVKNSTNIANPNSITATADSTKAEKAAPKNAASAYAKANPPPSIKEAANVQISPRAKEMSMAKKVIEETPDVREDKIAKYKEQIEKGEYKADAGKIADGILLEAMKDEVAKDPNIILR